MAVDDLEPHNTLSPPLPPMYRRSDNTPIDLPRGAKRSRGEPEDEHLARCLVALHRSVGDPSPSAVNPAPSADKRTKFSHAPPRSSGDPSPTATAFIEWKTKSPRTTIHAPPEANSYNCNLCERAFSSHQALGGHKASHKSKSQTAAEDNKTQISPSFNSPHPTGGIHKCSRCDKSYTTGQALGGHMRKHYDGVIRKHGGAKSRLNSSDGGNGNSSSVVTYSSGDASYGNDYSGRCTRVALNFDLNLPPSPEESEPPPDLTLKL